jgi:hypothetical protein
MPYSHWTPGDQSDEPDSLPSHSHRADLEEGVDNTLGLFQRSKKTDPSPESTHSGERDSTEATSTSAVARPRIFGGEGPITLSEVLSHSIIINHHNSDKNICPHRASNTYISLLRRSPISLILADCSEAVYIYSGVFSEPMFNQLS